MHALNVNYNIQTTEFVYLFYVFVKTVYACASHWLVLFPNVI